MFLCFGGVAFMAALWTLKTSLRITLTAYFGAVDNLLPKIELYGG